MKILSGIPLEIISKITASFLIVAWFGLTPLPASAQLTNTWTNPFTGNRFNNPLSSTLDTTILFSMQRRLTQSQLLGTLPSQRRAAAPAPQPMPVSPQSVAPPAPQHYAMTATNFNSGPRVLPSAYASTGPKEHQAQLLQTFNGMMDAFEKEAGKYNDAYAVAFLIGVSAQVHTGRQIPDPVIEKFAQDLNDILASSPSYQTLPVNKKQELYESSVLMGAMIGGLDTNPETKADAKKLARQVLQSIGAIP